MDIWQRLVDGFGAIATVLAVYFAWRALRDARATVKYSKQAAEAQRESLTIEQENLILARDERLANERNRKAERLERIGSLVAESFRLARQVEQSVAGAKLELRVTQEKLLLALWGFDDTELGACYEIVEQDHSPAGLGIIANVWHDAQTEVIEQLDKL